MHFGMAALRGLSGTKGWVSQTCLFNYIVIVLLLLLLLVVASTATHVSLLLGGGIDDSDLNPKPPRTSSLITQFSET